MCLRVATSRRPLHNTAYKVFQKFGPSYRTPFFDMYSPIKLGEWLTDKNTALIPYVEYYCLVTSTLTHYRAGFHCYLDLRDAIDVKDWFNCCYRTENLEYVVFRVDFDDCCAEYGVESDTSCLNKFWSKNRDVVVSRRIKPIEIIV